jgi:hypothetical protein
MRRGIWNVGVALAAPWLAGAVWGIASASAEHSLLEGVLDGASFTVYGFTTPWIVVATILTAVVARLRHRSPSRRTMLVVVGASAAAQFIGYYFWQWQRGDLATGLVAEGAVRLSLAFVVGGLVVGGFAGGLIRVGSDGPA